MLWEGIVEKLQVVIKNGCYGKVEQNFFTMFSARLGRPVARLSTITTSLPFGTSYLPTNPKSYQSLKMSTQSSEKYTLAFYVPKTHTAQCTEAIHKTGAGTWPGNNYGETCFIIEGKGQFRPLAGANPHTGKVDELERTDEHKVEMILFGRETLKKAVKAMKDTHPYEVVAYYVVKNEDI